MRSPRVVEGPAGVLPIRTFYRRDITTVPFGEGRRGLKRGREKGKERKDGREQIYLVGEKDKDRQRETNRRELETGRDAKMIENNREYRDCAKPIYIWTVR